MKHLFENRIWSDEIALWKYIQTINPLTEEIPDGYYMLEMVSDIGKVIFQEQFYFTVEDDDLATQFARHRDYIHARVEFEVRNGILTLRSLDGHEIKACDSWENGKWELFHYRDALLEATTEKRKYTLEDRKKAAQTLLELLMVSRKKVS